jgi:hypothetical protein
MVAVSPYSKGIGPVDTVDDSHYNLLSTFESLLGLPATGTGHDGTASFPAMKGLFHFPSKSTTVGSTATVVGIQGPDSCRLPCASRPPISYAERNAARS